MGLRIRNNVLKSAATCQIARPRQGPGVPRARSSRSQNLDSVLDSKATKPAIGGVDAKVLHPRTCLGIKELIGALTWPAECSDKVTLFKPFDFHSATQFMHIHSAQEPLLVSFIQRWHEMSKEFEGCLQILPHQRR